MASKYNDLGWIERLSNAVDRVKFIKGYFFMKIYLLNNIIIVLDNIDY